MKTTSVMMLCVLATLTAGCAGGGAGPSSAIGAAPVVAPSASPSASPKTQTKAIARFAITIPAAAAAAAARHRHYISPATQSIGITVAAQGGSAGAPVVVNVASSACAASSNGLTCAISVSAPIGVDVFTVTTYDQPGGSGNVLSSGSITGNVVAAHANSFPLVLGGTIASIALTPATSYLPVAQSGSTSITVAAYDASNNEIVGTYAAPIVLSAASGLTLSTATVASSSAGTLTVAYDGVSRVSLAITATSGTISGSAAIVPTTNVVYTNLPAGVNASPFKIVRGPDGAFYFGEFFGESDTGLSTLPGRVGRIDETGAVSEVQLAGENPVGLLFVGNDLYVAEEGSSSVGRIAHAAAGGFTAANYTRAFMPKHQANTIPSFDNGLDAPRSMALGSDGNVYVTNLYGADIASFNPATFGSGTISEIAANPSDADPSGIALGANGTLYVTATSFSDPGANVIETLVPGSTSVAAMTPTNAPSGPPDGPPAEYRFIALGSDNDLYFTELDGVGNFPGAGGRMTRLNPATGAYATVGMPSPYAAPDSVQAGAAGEIVFVDIDTNAVGIVQTANLAATEYPVQTAFDESLTAPQDVAVDSDGSLWFTAPSLAAETPGSPNTTPSAIGHLVLAQAWTLYPALPTYELYGIGSAGAQLIGVAGAATSGVTFSASSSNTGICTVAKVSGSSTNFLITGVAGGSCTVSVSDGSRTATVAVNVTNNTATIDTAGLATHRRLR